MVIMGRAVTFLLVTVLFTASNGDELQREDYRLANSIKPSDYKIYIEPKFNGQDFDSFEGNVTINAQVMENNVTEFRIHIGCNIVVDESSLKILKDEEEIDVSIKKDENYGNCTNNIQGEKEGNDFYLITVPEDSFIAQDNLTIFLGYEATFPPGMYGFYKSYYTDQNKQQRVLLTTQFEQTHARKAFPCFDEPGFKAQFSLTFLVPRGYHVLSNAKEEPQEPGEKEEAETHTVNFKKTTIMSPYLVAFIVYHNETFISTPPNNNDTYSTLTWGRAQEIKEGAGDLSQLYTPPILESMLEYTGIPYLLTSLDHMPDKPEKVDQAAIPDFSAGAMENWGLVTYRETALLYKEGKHSETAKKRVVEVIAHELAHQWFGNLVTTKWWNSAWLNEGFATLFEYLVTKNVSDAMDGDWRLMERFIADDQIKALGVDAYNSAPPLTLPEDKLLTGSQASNHFGTITYSKGGSVLRMFQNIVGPEKFQEAVQKYLKNMAGKAAEPLDLLKELNEVSENCTLTDVFQKWTTQNGFPLISLDRNASGVYVSQKRYLIGEGDTETKYDVKITLSSADEVKDFWLKSDEESKMFEDLKDNWLLVNTTGFFRVKYFDNNWKLLVNEMHNGNASKIEPVERAVLVDNALNLARFDHIEYSVAIDVLNYLQQEIDFIPWYTASIELNFLHRMLVNSEGDQDNTINTYIQRLIAKVYEQVIGKKDDHISKVHRANILNWACRVGHEECLELVRNKFPVYINNESDDEVDPDIINTVYCYGVQTNGTAWTQLWSELQKEEDAIIRTVIISALGCSKNKVALAMYLDSGILRGTIRTQDAPAVFSSVYSNPDGIEVALQFLETNFEEVEKKVDTVMNGLANMISGIAQYLSTESQKQRILAIGEKDETVKAFTETAAKTIQANMEWKKNHEKKVLNILKEKMSPDSAGAKQPAVIMLALTFIISVFLL